jgi:polyhydroxybutyrate depolymerase
MIRKKYQKITFVVLLISFGCCFLVIGQETTGDLTAPEEVITPSDALISDTEPDPIFSLYHDGIKRTYGVHLPLNYADGRRKNPVVIYLHGAGGDIGSAYQDGIDKIADKYGFILAIPVATRTLWWQPSSTRWNGGEWEGGECCGAADDVGFISKMIAKLRLQYNVNPNQIYATGISNGGLMVNRLACELSDKIAAVAVVAPTAIPQNCVPSISVSVMGIHGTGDPCNPYDGSQPAGACGKVSYTRMSPGEVVDAWLNILGCSQEYTTVYDNGDANCISYNGSNGSEVTFCKVEKMGHTWPSGSQYLPESIVGPVSNDISTDQIWEFFQRHSLWKNRFKRASIK